MTKIIHVEHLTKTYRTYKRDSGLKSALKSFFRHYGVIVNAVHDVSFDIEEGEICGILGPNGAGKSTTIKMLCGALYPTSGSIRVMGYDPAKNRTKYVQYIGAVFGQKSQLNWDIPPIDSFRMNQAIYDIPDGEYKARLAELSELLDVTEVMQKPTRVLSLGERMKCEFIMAMLHSPKIVFLDEPTIGLDVIAKLKVREFIKQMNAKGTTFILTTHDLEDVEQLADRIIIINHGEKVFDDSIKQLRHSLGSSKTIELTLAMPYNGEDVSPAVIIEQPSDRQLTLNVDTQQISFNEYIGKLAKTLSFTDISIKELPMEQIVKHIYEEV